MKVLSALHCDIKSRIVWFGLWNCGIQALQVNGRKRAYCHCILVSTYTRKTKLCFSTHSSVWNVKCVLCAVKPKCKLTNELKRQAGNWCAVDQHRLLMSSEISKTPKHLSSAFMFIACYTQCLQSFEAGICISTPWIPRFHTFTQHDIMWRDIVVKNGLLPLCLPTSATWVEVLFISCVNQTTNVTSSRLVSCLTDLLNG